MATIEETWTLRTNHRKIVRYTDGTYSATYASCSFSKTVGGITTDSPSDGKVEYSFDGMAYTEGAQVNASEIQENGGQVEFRLIVRGSTILTSIVSVVAGGGGSIPVTYSGGKAEIEISPDIALGSRNILLTLQNTSTGATEAAKTVSLVPAGTPGASSGSLDISPSVLFVPADSDGLCRSSFEKECMVRMFVNNNWATITDVKLVKQGMSGAGIETYGLGGRSEYNFKVTVNYGVAEKSYSGFLKITVTGVVGDKTFKAYGTLSVEGNRKGDNAGATQGVALCLCYLTGEYSDSITYLQERDNNGNVTSTPAVEIPVEGSSTSELWYLDALTNVVNGTHIGPKDSNQTVWKQGLSNYNLVRTKYLFADFASLGQFVICGAWMLSRCGIVYGADGTTYFVDDTNCDAHVADNKPAYMFFDPEYVRSDKPGVRNFCPNFAVDGRTGEIYEKKAHIAGDVTATRLLCSDGSMMTEISPGMAVFSSILHPLSQLIIGTDNNGMVFKMTDKDGRVIWNLGGGTGGIGSIESGGGDYTTLYYKRMSGATPSKSEFINIRQSDCTQYYRYNGRWASANGAKQWAVGEEAKNGIVHTTETSDPSSSLIQNGWYTKPNNGQIMAQIDSDTKTVVLYRYSGGRLAETKLHNFT